MLKKIINDLDNYEKFLKFWSLQYRYSFKNTLILYDNDSNGSLFATKKQWENMGYNVKPNAIPIIINHNNSQSVVYEIAGTEKQEANRQVVLWSIDKESQEYIANKLNTKKNIDNNLEIGINKFVTKLINSVLLEFTEQETEFLLDVSLALILNRCNIKHDIKINFKDFADNEYLFMMMQIVHSISRETLNIIQTLNIEYKKNLVIIDDEKGIKQENHSVPKLEDDFIHYSTNDKENKITKEDYKEPKFEEQQQETDTSFYKDDFISDTTNDKENEIIEDGYEESKQEEVKQAKQPSLLKDDHIPNDGKKEDKQPSFFKNKDFVSSENKKESQQKKKNEAKQEKVKQSEQLSFFDDKVFNDEEVKKDDQEKSKQTKELSPIKDKARKKPSETKNTPEQEDILKTVIVSETFTDISNNHLENDIKKESSINIEKSKEISEPPIKENDIVDNINIELVGENYKIKDGYEFDRGAKTRFNNNVNAIATMLKIESENQIATLEEQDILVKYSGWGGLINAFDPTNASWQKEYEQLKDLLNDKEYEKARVSSLTAYYTPTVVIDTIYKALIHMGFAGGNILEPSMGIGNFFGRLPGELEKSNLYGVELDNISGRIAKLLYPKAKIEIGGYENTKYPDGLFDVVLGNVPFGEFSVSDNRYKENFFIHDYFIQKSLDKVRTGGIIAFVTSSGTMEKFNKKARKYISERANLVGAFRLPSDTFGSYNLNLTTDILFLQKKDTIEVGCYAGWQDVIDYDDLPINHHFFVNQDMIIGNLVKVKNRFGKEEYTCEHDSEKNFNFELQRAVSKLPVDIIDYSSLDIDVFDSTNVIYADDVTKENAFKIIDNTVYQRKGSIMVKYDCKAIDKDRIIGLCTIKDSLKNLFDFQLEGCNDEVFNSLLLKFNSIYDNFVKKHGYINKATNSNAFSDDPDSYLLLSVEDEVKKEDGKITYKKGIVFSERTLKRNVVITHANNVNEALIYSLNIKGNIDINYMMELIDCDEDYLLSELADKIFKDPVTEKWIIADEYLSGDVKLKLDVAKKMVEFDESYFKNVIALEKVQPVSIPFEKIIINLGATWIPARVIKSFVLNLLEIDVSKANLLSVSYDKALDQWKLDYKHGLIAYDDINNTKTYGTSRANAIKIINSTLNFKDITIRDKQRDGSLKYNPTETALIKEKQTIIKDKFIEWLSLNDEIKAELETLYNDKFNRIVQRKFDGSQLILNGMSSEIKFSDHQNDAVARGIYSGNNSLLAHCVGAGKTYTVIAICMELRRLGISQKPMIVVPNALIGQWAKEFMKLYPMANILASTEKDFAPKKRKQFLTKIATGNYDAIIIGQSQFKMIPVSEALITQHIDDELAQINEAINDAQRNKNKDSLRSLLVKKQNTEKNLNSLIKETKKDNVILFEELGVDYLLIDEADIYKNLGLITKQSNISGITTTGSQQSTDLYIKCKYINKINNNRGVIFATATPISNSMVELYTMQRYLQPDALAKAGLSSFDSWASVFGEVITNFEVTATGAGFTAKKRFSKFNNIPELMTMFGEVADIKTADMLSLKVPKLKFNRQETITAPKSEYLKNYIDKLVERADEIKANKVDSKVDNMLKVTTDGRKIALDLRLIDPEFPDLPDSKVNLSVKNIYNIWKETEDKKLTQIVFCDLSTPNPNKFNVYYDMREKWIKLGIPKEEIAFIHDYDTDAKKLKLYDDINYGRVRILMGSTAKMGAGVNVQRLLVALHRLDVPWRPRDIEQQLGRILRQGNLNSEVQIFSYVTEGSFDVYSYQTLEVKAKFINQIMRGESIERSMEDINGSEIDYRHLVAIASGNPLLMEKFKVDSEVKRLQLLKDKYEQNIKELTRELSELLPLELHTLSEQKKRLVKDINNRSDLSGDNFLINISGVTYEDRKKAGETLLKLIRNLENNTKKVVGKYANFDLAIYKEFHTSHMAIISTDGKTKYSNSVGESASGNITRVENLVRKLDDGLIIVDDKIRSINLKMDKIKEELKKPFTQAETLLELELKKTEIDNELNLDKTDVIIDVEPTIIEEVGENTRDVVSF